MMDNHRLAPANVDANDLPTGFSTTDPSGSSASAENDGQAQQRQMQKDAILQQALTPEALERLRRIKVSSNGMQSQRERCTQRDKISM
jgi:DNA-binding TFAR19-related protein (PDSD5 family)